MRFTRIAPVLTATTALSAALVLATPASAVTSGGANSCGYYLGSGWQQCAGVAQDIPGIGSAGTDVQVNCDAYSQAYVQATIVQCFILGNNGDKHYTPSVYTQGYASSLTYTFDSWAHNLTSRTYQLCIQAGYVSGDGYTFVARNPACGFTV
ncbi:MAG TPA: hypothetical protein VNA20_14300 [Frankiaceae bacterium]|nr:hypothetical protein [Frankiaceae bacterium]